MRGRSVIASSSRSQGKVALTPEGLREALVTYAELVVRIGLNLQRGQRLVIGNPRHHGVALYAAPLVRLIAEQAYKSGARFVDVMWSDEPTRLVRFQHASRDSFTEYPAWQAQGLLDYVSRGDSHLTVLANDPDLLRGQDPEAIATAQQVTWERLRPFYEHVTRNAINWCVVSAAGPGWAARVFPQADPREQEARPWRAILEISRVLQVDPVSGWQRHLDGLAARADYLSAKQYAALRFRGPGTDLMVGLPAGHIWEGGRSTSAAGIVFTANMPTEEVFTLPHRDRVEGEVTATRPLSTGGTLVDGFRLRFAEGRVVEATAREGESVLRRILETDDGSARLGEVALVPHSSPIARSGLLFYNTLIDETRPVISPLGRGTGPPCRMAMASPTRVLLPPAAIAVSCTSTS